jgi:oligopeptide transport system substrate-binding protein
VFVQIKRCFKVKPHIDALCFLTWAAALVTTACTTDSSYFGKTTTPSGHRLVYLNGSEPGSLDPVLCPCSNSEINITQALFEGLTSDHPKTGGPMAALATHYETSADQTQFVFYLRGHPNPRGTRLPDREVLDSDYSRNHPAPPDRIPARWSDGTNITAHDFVRSWRRVIDPRTASPNAYSLYYVKNGEEINEGKRKPEDLGVQALDEYALRVELRAPAAFFLKLTSDSTLVVLPPHLDWTACASIVASGPFRLKEWRPNDRIVLARNPYYYDAALVSTDEVVLLPIAVGATGVNLYKCGEADAMNGRIVPPMLLPALREKRDFHIAPSTYLFLYVINTRRPPFNNVLLRYALNMATDKKAIAEFVGAGVRPASGAVPYMAVYQSPKTLPVVIEGKSYDVLAYDPKAARELMAKAGFGRGVGSDGRRPSLELLYPGRPRTEKIAQILQQQWRANLGITVELAIQEEQVWNRSVVAVDYKAVAEGGWSLYVDPSPFLETFLTGSPNNPTGWSDPKFDTLLAEANSTSCAPERMRKLADCERYLLRWMPIIPIYSDVWYYLEKPYVRGLGVNSIGASPFKYAWIDTNWRPEAVGGQGSRSQAPGP